MSTMTSEDKTYNGWANYPTWAVNLWLSNDEGLYNETTERVKEAMNGATWNVITEKSNERYDVANALKTWVRDDLATDLGASFEADLLGYAFDLVDWYEIADAWIGTYNEENETEDE